MTSRTHRIPAGPPARSLLAALVLLAVSGVPAAARQTPGELTREQIEAAYHRSYEHEQRGNIDDALRALNPVLTTYPQGYTVNLRTAWLYYLRGNYANATSHYDAALLARPYSLEPPLGQTLVLLAQERWAEAELAAYRVVSVDHHNYYGNLRLAVALRMQGKLDAAAQIVGKMTTAYPTDVTFLVELARIAVAAGDADEARRLFHEIRILDPENEAARSYLGGS